MSRHAREERKVVTVLFADLVGFTARAESLDPEDVAAVLRPYHERLRTELERWGGTVEKFIGDAVVAVFGAPVAREDDPERAVRAALAIRDWATEDGDVEVRIAVNTGEALVALDVRPESGEGFVTGDVVNTASRLQTAAPVNGILVGEQTQRATRHVIDYRDAEDVVAKGKTEPVAVWEALQARSRFGVDVRQHGAAPLVGRARELEALTGTLGRVKEEREPQLVTLVGVPGIGKSRLVWELFGAIERGDTLTYWRQGRSLPYGQGVSFWAMAEMVKAHAGILEGDDSGVVLGKLERAVREAVDDEADWVAARLRPLVGVESEGAGASRDESFTAWRRFWESLAERHPLVLAFEDIHWADEGLLDFIEHLADWARGVPILVLCSARPELFERRPGWGGGKLNSLTLALSPLSNAESAKLLALVLDRAVLPAETQEALLERASGNPLYAEQFARLYLERGSAEDLPLPESVHGLIAARLDALPDEEKALLQDAAVMGKVFWSGALGADGRASERLHSLERKDFIRGERRSSVEGEQEFAFRHVLVRDVAYGQIPRADRAAMHVRAADWIESLGRPQDHAELLAHHCSAALELEAAAGRDPGALPGRAARALREAGDRAAALNAFSSAVGFYRSALGLLPDDAPDRAELLFSLGRSEFYAESGGDAALEEASALLQARGDVDAAAEAENLIARSGFMTGDTEKTDTHLAHAARLVAEAPPSPAKASVISTQARSAYLRADYSAALALAQEALAMAESLGLEAIRAEALVYAGGSKFDLGDDSGIDDLRRSIEISNAINSPDSARAYNNLGVLLRTQGDLRSANESWNEGLRVAERFGLEPYILFDRSGRPYRHYERGEWEESLRLATAFIEGAPARLGENSWICRAFIRVARGDDAGALEDTARALEIARLVGYPQSIYPSISCRAFVLASIGELAAADALLDELASRQDKTLSFGGPSIAPWTWAQLGRADEFVSWFGEGRRTPWLDAAAAAAERDWGRAAQIYRHIGSSADEAFALLQTAGEGELRAALDFYRSVAAKRYIRQAEAQLAAIA
jgi:class 3 adenylate cyclase/tetratricopeptide (TPR) repeat protein